MKLLFSAFAIAGSISCLGQTGGASQGPSGGFARYEINHINHNRMQTYAWSERPDEEARSLQKKFSKQEWTTGVVYFKSGRPFMEVPLLFDVHNDMLYYKQGEVIMEFVDTVSQVSMLIPYKKDSLLMIFRRNYPSIQANTPHTFYQILVEGKITLLKCMSKSILLFKDNDSPEARKDDPPGELYFAHMPGNKIVQVWFDAEKTIRNMSEYDWMLRDVMKKNKIKLKDEQRLVELFSLLNQQFQ
jgi:hypothetical protein